MVFLCVSYDAARAVYYLTIIIIVGGYVGNQIGSLAIACYGNVPTELYNVVPQKSCRNLKKKRKMQSTLLKCHLNTTWKLLPFFSAGILNTLLH